MKGGERKVDGVGSREVDGTGWRVVVGKSRVGLHILKWR